MNKLLKIIFIISIYIFILLTIFEYSSLNVSYFKNKFEENNTDEITGKSTEELISISEKIISYLKGKRDDLIIYDEKGLVFEGREVEHMKDVKTLFNRGYMIRNIFLVSALAAGLVLKFFYKDRILKLLFYGGILFGFVLILIGLIIIFNFDRAFVIFHEILFSNDLWILNPEQDLLIQMLPSNFFSDLGLIIVKRYVLTTVVISAIYLLNKKINKNKKEVTR
jgi:integral membrane protein (TIGR01906 family)